jgi:hypothetical protein
MKGTIVNCLKELLVNKFGKDKWEQVCEKTGFDSGSLINLCLDVPDEQALALINATSEVLGITAEQASHAFGDYWVNDYASVIYKSELGRFKCVRDVLFGLDAVHARSTATIPNARPPRFIVEDRGEGKLTVTYKSHRGLIDIYIGAVRGLGRYFNESVKVSKRGNDKVDIVIRASVLAGA